VGCCDSSKNKHASKHFEEMGHPLVRSIEPGERWMWCYTDEMARAIWMTATQAEACGAQRVQRWAQALACVVLIF
jgi:hypothetical protein